MDDDVTSTPSALLQCLRMLSEESAALRMVATFAALQEAIAICRAETEAMPPELWAGLGQTVLH